MAHTQKQNFIDNSKVIIKPLAYYKMLVHILRFGSKIKDPDNYRECMGVLLGELEGSGEIKDVIIHDAVPINHGGQIEVQFSEADYISFASIDAEVADKGWFSVGWYHSHPGLGVFFSAVDLINQLGFQNPNPSAIGIVFDHELLEEQGNMGFKIFRLDKPSFTEIPTSYHEVKYIVEPPDNIGFYHEIKNLIDNIHKKEPVILEINETPDIFGEISVPSQSQMMAKQPDLNLMELMQSLNDGISKFTYSFFEPLIRYLDQWGQKTTKLTIDINLKTREDLITLKDNLSNGLRELHTWTKFAIMDIFRDMETYIDDKLDILDINKNALKSSIHQLKDTIESNISKIFTEQINTIIKETEILINDSKEKFTSLKSIYEINSNHIVQNTKLIDEDSRKIDQLGNKTVQEIDLNSEKIKKQLEKTLKPLIKEINEIKKKQEDFIGSLDSTISILDKVSNNIQKLKNINNKNQGGS